MQAVNFKNVLNKELRCGVRVRELESEQFKQQNNEGNGCQHHQQEPFALEKIHHTFHTLLKQLNIYALVWISQN